MQDARKVPIYRALHRANLFMGGERKLVQTLMAIAGTVLVSNPASPTTWLIVGTVYGACLAGLRKLAKKDPRFSEVYRRQLNDHSSYPPRSQLPTESRQPWQVVDQRLSWIRGETAQVCEERIPCVGSRVEER